MWRWCQSNDSSSIWKLWFIYFLHDSQTRFDCSKREANTEWTSTKKMRCGMNRGASCDCAEEPTSSEGHFVHLHRTIMSGFSVVSYNHEYNLRRATTTPLDESSRWWWKTVTQQFHLHLMSYIKSTKREFDVRRIDNGEINPHSLHREWASLFCRSNNHDSEILSLNGRYCPSSEAKGDFFLFHIDVSKETLEQTYRRELTLFAWQDKLKTES